MLIPGHYFRQHRTATSDLLGRDIGGTIMCGVPLVVRATTDLFRNNPGPSSRIVSSLPRSILNLFSCLRLPNPTRNVTVLHHHIGRRLVGSTVVEDMVLWYVPLTLSYIGMHKILFFLQNFRAKGLAP